MMVLSHLRRALTLRGAVLTSTMLFALSIPKGALAACTVTSTPNSVTCAVNTTTTATTNTDAANPSSSDQDQVFTTGGAVTGTVNAGVIVDGNGLRIDNTNLTGATAITFSNAGSIRGSTGNALDLRSRDGPLSYTGDGNIAGAATGLYTLVGPGGLININTGSGSIAGSAIGLYAVTAFSGGISINTGSGSIAGSSVGLLAQLNGPGGISINAGTGSISAAAGDGINTSASVAPGTIDVTTNGTISATGAAIRAQTQRGGNITVTVNGGAVGGAAASAGVVAGTSRGGDVQVNANGGTISSSQNAIDASATSGKVTVNGNGSVIGANNSLGNATAIRAVSFPYPFTPGGYAVRINLAAGSVTSSGVASTGIFALTDATSSISITIGAGVIVSATGTSSATGLVMSGTDNATATVLGTLSASAPGSTGIAADFSGTLNVGNGGNSGTLIGNVNMQNSNALLTFNRFDAYEFSQSIGGAGSVEQDGTGALRLSSINTYTGATTVNAGALIVSGSIASSSLTTVNAGALLGGDGTVGNTTINGGVLAPGNSVGVLSVQGNLVLTAAASYLVEVSGASADKTSVSGTAALGGANLDATFSGTTIANKYSILNAAGGVSGSFGTFNVSGTPTGFTAGLSYDANNAWLSYSFSPNTNGLNANQRNLMGAVTNAFNAGNAIPVVFGAVNPAMLTEASGEGATGSQQTTFQAMTQFLGTLLDPFIGGRGSEGGPQTGATPYAEDSDAHAYASRARTQTERDAYAAIYRKAPLREVYDPRWSVWAAGFGGSQTTDGNAVQGSNSTTSSIYGTAVGADYRFSPTTIAGFALAGGGTNFSIANGLGGGRSDLFQAGVFAKHTNGAAYISAALAYGWQDVTTDRTITIAGIDRLRAEFNANAFSGRAEGGYRFVAPIVGGIGVTPYAAGQFTTFDLPAYAEQVLSGSNMFAMTYGSRSVTDMRSELGLRADKSFAMSNAILTLRGRAAWAHDFNPDRSIGATFQTLPGASFTVNGAAQAPDSALTTASAEVKWLNGWSAAASFEGEFSDVTRSYAGKGIVRYAW